MCDLAMQSDLALFDGNVTGVASCWFRLAQEHLDDARVALSSGRSRAVYSRAYYGAYNASKAVRYLVNGEVSLKGDDHRKASELPDDFPRVDHWSRVITELYEDRLRADYENWANTPAEHTHLPDECLRHADGFVAECRQYLLRSMECPCNERV